MSEAPAHITRPDISSNVIDVGWTDCDLDPSISPGNEALVRQGITRAVLGRLPRASVTLSPEPNSHGITTRFVIAAPPHPDPVALRDLHAQGVRGVRFKISGNADRVRTQLDRILRYADGMAGCGWHIELQFSNGSALPCDSEWTLMRFPVAVCLSGIADIAARCAPDDAELEFILVLLRLGRTWIKLPGAAVTPGDEAAPDRINRFVSAALATRRDRIVWSSGALQARSQHAAADALARVAAALAMLRQWIPDNVDREAVLAANPSQLYGFETAS